MPALIAFDLDDTLYRERDYVASGRRAVAEALARNTDADAGALAAVIEAGGRHGFEDAIEASGTTSLVVADLVRIYDAHMPDIMPETDAHAVLTELSGRGHRLMLITDGTSERQRAKIRALGLERFFGTDGILISSETGGDKLSGVPAALADAEARRRRLSRRIYVGDNPAKDFAAARSRGWTTVMLLDAAGRNVHPQRLDEVPHEYRPDIVIFNLTSILALI